MWPDSFACTFIAAVATPENRCSFPREAVTACGVRLLTMWRVKAGADYRRMAERSRHDSQAKIHQAGQNLVIVRTDAGEGIVSARGCQHVLGKHSLLIFDFPSLEEYHSHGQRWNFWWVELSVTEPLHLPLHRVFEIPPATRENTRCEEVFDKLHAERIDQQHLAAAIWQNLFIDWWGLAEAGTPRLTPADMAVQRTVESIKRRPDLPWSLEQMATIAGMSPSTLRISCQNLLGKTPSQVKLQLKLSHAYEHLRRGDRNVTEVAEALGFCDPFHFSKAFKRQFGINPSGVHNHQR